VLVRQRQSGEPRASREEPNATDLAGYTFASHSRGAPASINTAFSGASYYLDGMVREWRLR
jgi:hypothetical protein